MAIKETDQRRRRRAAIRVGLLFVVLGLIVWHAVDWHSSGMYLEMVKWLGTGRGYLAVLYNLGLMLVTGALLGVLAEKVVDLVSRPQSERRKERS